MPAFSLSHPFNTVPHHGRAFRGFVQRKRREREQESAEVIQRYEASPPPSGTVSGAHFWLWFCYCLFTAISNLCKPNSWNMAHEVWGHQVLKEPEKDHLTMPQFQSQNESNFYSSVRLENWRYATWTTSFCFCRWVVCNLSELIREIFCIVAST